MLRETDIILVVEQDKSCLSCDGPISGVCIRVRFGVKVPIVGSVSTTEHIHLECAKRLQRLIGMRIEQVERSKRKDNGGVSKSARRKQHDHTTG